MRSTILVGCNRLSTLELRDYWAGHKGIKNNSKSQLYPDLRKSI